MVSVSPKKVNVTKTVQAGSKFDSKKQNSLTRRIKSKNQLKIQTPVWLQFLSKDNENNKRKFTFTIKEVFFLRRGASLSLLFFACLPIPNLKSIFDMPSQTNSQILDIYFAMQLF